MTKVLIIAYACEPHRGSEAGTGWNLALRLAKEHLVTVITRANNRTVNEEALAGKQQKSRPKFIYVDPPSWVLFLKKKKVFPTQIFYWFWQREVAKRLKQEASEYDIVHQLTFNSFEVPAKLFSYTKSIKVWGPVGGGQRVNRSFLRAFPGKSKLVELQRNFRVLLSGIFPLVRRGVKNSDFILFANEETRLLLDSKETKPHTMMIDVGVDLEQFDPKKGVDLTPKEKEETVFLVAGRLEGRKGCVFLLQAFQKLLEKLPTASLRFVGDGPLQKHLEKLANELGIETQVEFLGRVDHAAMRQEFECADVFVFPSLRDTSGSVVLEAMAMKLPVVCLNHQGAGIMVEDGCGIKINVGSYDETINSFAKGMLDLALNPDLRSEMGEAGRNAVAEKYDWSSKANTISNLYNSLLLKIEN